MTAHIIPADTRHDICCTEIELEAEECVRAGKKAGIFMRQENDGRDRATDLIYLSPVQVDALRAALNKDVEKNAPPLHPHTETPALQIADDLGTTSYAWDVHGEKRGDGSVYLWQRTEEDPDREDAIVLSARQAKVLARWLTK